MQSTVFLVDDQIETRNSTEFLLKLAGYEVEKLDGPEITINRLEQVRDGDGRPFCVVINHGELSRQTRHFLELLDAKQLGIPVLIIDREHFNLRRDDYGRSLGPEFPLFVCRPEEMIEVVGHLNVLRHRLLTLTSRARHSQAAIW